MERLEAWVAAQPGGQDPQVAVQLATAHQIREQDVEVAGDGTPTLRQGVARDRRISIEDPQMRHGRKTRSVRVDGYKRHVARDPDAGLIRAVGVTPANLPEATVADQIQTDLTHQDAHLSELHIDRAYLASSLVADRDPDLTIYCKAFPVRNGPRFAKTAFTLDFDWGLLTCPNQVRMPFTPGGKVQFPAPTCQACPLRAQCTTSAHGRSVQLHPDEHLLAELRDRQLTPTAAPSCGSVSAGSTAWPTSAAGRAAAPATGAPARTCSTCAATPSCTTCTSPPTKPNQPPQPNKPPKPDTRPVL